MIKSPPTEGHLSRLYWEMGRIGAGCVGVCKKWPYGEPDRISVLVLASEMVRYDPRLLTILVVYCLKNFRDLNPAMIRGLYPVIDLPQVWAVIAEFIKSAADDKEAVLWADYLQRGLHPVPLQFFYHYIYAPGGFMSDRAIESSAAEYKRWGFLACERPIIDPRTKRMAGSLDKPSRLNILRRLMCERKEICLADYIAALNMSISRQQALADLKGMKRVVRRGRGRGAKWRLTG